MKIKSFITILLVASVLASASIVSAEQLPFYKSKQTIRIGMSGSLVYSLQTYLAEMGILPRDLITGYFGQITRIAVKIFQIKNGIEGVGVVGPKTKNKIRSLVLAADTAATRSTLQLSSPLLVATSSEIGRVVTVIATSSDSVKYSLAMKPDYDFKKLSKDIQNLVNERRDEIHLNPVYWEDELAMVAEDHSEDQAKDNLEITNRDIVCHYPIIRHEGFTKMGYSLKDRYASRNIDYRYGGENIAMVPVSKNLLYLYLASEPITKCIDVERFSPGQGTQEERTALFHSVLNRSKEAVKDRLPVNWVNREWRTDKEIAEIVVNGWMNSPGHRENILRKEYNLGGVGIASVNDDIVVTHNFASR